MYWEYENYTVNRGAAGNITVMQGNTMDAPPMTSQQQNIFPKRTATEFLQASLSTVHELYMRFIYRQFPSLARYILSSVLDKCAVSRLGVL